MMWFLPERKIDDEKVIKEVANQEGQWVVKESLPALAGGMLAIAESRQSDRFPPGLIYFSDRNSIRPSSFIFNKLTAVLPIADKPMISAPRRVKCSFQSSSRG